MNIKIHNKNQFILCACILERAGFGLSQGTGQKSLCQHRPATIAIPEVLDVRPLRGSQSSLLHGAGLLHPPHQDPGSLEPQSDWRWGV